jgi:class 3 adenylate cyclase/predicted ATPase
MWSAAMDVGEWLKGIGLGKYEETFRANAIDANLLPRLTGDDLKEIGVSAFGDRLRLLDGIAALAGAKPTSDAPVPPSKPVPPKSPEVSAERRPITVMFCDLVGSTSIAAKLDAEDWRNLVNAYLDEASKAVTGLGGHVLKRLGDGLMALFGYPQAQENDAERAVRGALAIQRALTEINARNASKGLPELSARIGIESGPVVVEATGEVFGDSPNVAARVQAAAEPGSVLVTMNVQRQVAGLFVAEDQRARELKGVTEPVQLFRIVRASGGGRRGGARALTPFVGREEELGLLARRWERARTGDGQLALVVGEPGLGKSRLIEEFHARLAETPHTWTEWSASQLLQNTPLHPIAEWGRQRFGMDAPAEQRLADLENTLRLVGLDPAEHAPLLAPLVDIPLPPDRAASFPPEELRRRQLAAMSAWALAGARSQPLVLAIEDLHWADPTSLDLLKGLAERVAQAPLLLLATARPEFRAPWSLRSHHVVISLSPLDRAGVAQMVGEISSRHALSKEFVEGVTERTGGVPLFVEEVTRLLLERGEQGGVQAIPPTLQQSLAARLDRLGPAREIAQIGSVLGRDFAYPLLRGIAETDEAALLASLDRLADADLLFVEGAPPQAAYRFKHALIQDAAYDSLLKSRRQALHRRAGEVLRDDPDRAAAEPEVIAHHFTQAGLEDLAIEWWGKAGDTALRRSAFQEAIAHLSKAITMADKAGAGKAAGESGERRQLHVAYGNALLHARGYGARETIEAFVRAREVSLVDQDMPERLAADYGLWVGSYVRGDLSSMRVHAETFLGDVGARSDSPEAGVAHRVAGITHWVAGEYTEAREQLEASLAAFQPGRDDELTFRFGQDPGVAAPLCLAIVLWPIGEVGRAGALLGDAEARMRDLAHIGTRMYGRIHAALFELIRGESSRATSNTAELARLVREHELPQWRAFVVFFEGLARAGSDDPLGGLHEMRCGVELLREQNVMMFDGLIKIVVAEIEARTSDIDRALATIDEALATCERTGQRAFEAELHRVRGEMLLKRDPANPARAEEALQTSIAVAKRQTTRSFELRASLSLAKLYQSTGRPAEAYAILAPALEGLAPTQEMPEIAEAQALLAALAELDEVKSAAASRQRRLRLQTRYGQAMMYSRGFGSADSKTAFARARTLAAGAGDASERFEAYYGLVVGSVLRGELSLTQETAESFLRDAENEGQTTEAAVARRCVGMARLYQGDFLDAEANLAEALRTYNPERDRDARFRFSADTAAAAAAALTLAIWALGDVERARALSEEALARAEDTAHAPTRATVYSFISVYHMLRGDPETVRRTAKIVVVLGREHGMAMWLAGGEVHSNWARAWLDDRESRITGLREALATYLGQGNKLFVPLFQGRLAELEGEENDADGALRRIDEALALASETGEHWTDALLHRIRGEILLKRERANPAPAEEAFLAAIAVSQAQKVRSFELQAALALANVLQSTGRPVEAHAVLAPALEGFAPTPEMPEIAEAQALLAALAETDQVKNAAAVRLRQLQLQTAYGRATMWSRGLAPDEAAATFARAKSLTEGAGDINERFAALYGLWITSLVRGELQTTREAAETFRREAESLGRVTEVAVGHRFLGLTSWSEGNFTAAKAHLEEALRLHDPERDRDTKFRYAVDTHLGATLYLAPVSLMVGDIEGARRLIDEGVARAVESGHVMELINACVYKSSNELVLGNAQAVLNTAETYSDICRKHQLEPWPTFTLQSVWARARLGDRKTGIAELRRALAACLEKNWKSTIPGWQARLAELEAEEEDFERALLRIDEALALARVTGAHSADAFLHRVRGEIYLKRDPANPAPAEEAFLTALAIAHKQGGRLHGLRASLSLAGVYQSTGRTAEAHAVLAPALEGFAPTPEMPEIAEAQALLAALDGNSVNVGGGLSAGS